MSSSLTLDEFPPVSTEQWDEMVRADLKGVEPAARLYYRAEDLQGLEYLDSAPGEFPYTRGVRRDNAWRIRVVAGDAEAARAALDAGAEEICYVLGDQDIGQVLDTLPACPVHFEAGSRAAALLEALLERLLGRASACLDIQLGSVDYEPLANFDQAAHLIRRSSVWPNFHPITVRAHRFSEGGSTIVQELAFALAEGVEIVAQLTDRGLTPAAAARALAFSFATGSNYFAEIAKLRAARTVWARAFTSFQPAETADAKMTVYARTSHWTKTIYDAHMNLLRGTTEAMAAAIGGADAIQVEEYDETYRTPDAAARRLARNTQLILKREALLDRTVDPAGGSYYLEVLTDSLAREAWKMFQQVEAAGGFLRYSASGALERDIAKSRADREAAVSTRRTAIVGTNQYPNLAERMLPKIEREDPTPRGAQIFERIRLRTERHAARTGRTPRFLLLEAGESKMRKARSSFSADLFGCAGFEVQIADTITGDPDVVVICSSDSEYAALSPQVIDALRAAGKSTPVVAADVPANAAETLRAWQDRLGVQP